MILLITALALMGLVVSAQAATWDTTMVYYATTVTKYDVAVGNYLKGAADDTVRILTTQNASPFGVLLATDRSTALPMNWVTETIHTNTIAMRGCAIGDVDGDGQNEIIIGHTATPFGLKMIKWSGSAWVTTTVLTSTSSYVGAIHDVAIGDADNNSGTPNDIVFNNSSYGVMKARWNNSTSTFDTTRILYNTTNSTYYGVAIGDFDQTYAGNEIVTVSYGQRVYRIKWNSATWDTATIFYTTTDYDYYDVAVGNFDASNPGGEIAINNGYNYASGGAVQEVYGSGSTWAMRNLGYNPTTWGGSGEIAVGDFYSGNAGEEIVAVSGGGSAYEARLFYGSGTTWSNEKIMGTGSYAYGVAVGNVNRYHAKNPIDELAVGGNYRVWEAEERPVLAVDVGVSQIYDPNSCHLYKISTLDSIAVVAKNYGSTPETNFWIKYRMSSGIGRDSVFYNGAAIPLNGTATVYLRWTPGVVGLDTAYAWTELGGDMFPGNDLLKKAFTVTTADVALYENFEGVTPTAFPSGWAVVNSNGDAYTWLTQATGGNLDPQCARYPYGSVAANDWFFTCGVTLQAGKLYKVEFYYKGQSASYIEKMNVNFGTSQLVADTLPRIWDNAAITNITYSLGEATFNPPTTRTYYLGFHCYSAANQYYLYVDNIKIYALPTNDVGVSKIFAAPCGIYKVGSPDSIGLEVKNFAAGPQSNFWVHYDLALGTGTDSIFHTNTLAAGTRDTVFIPWTPGLVGVDTIYGWTSLSGDENPYNDLLKSPVTVYPAGVVLYQDFEGITPPAFPSGWTVLDVNGGTTWLTYAETSPVNKCARYPYSGSLPGDDWFFTCGVNLTAGQVYKAEFYYKDYSYSAPEAMKVHFATCPAVACTLTRIWDNSNIINASYVMGSGTFIPPTTGTYYLGFHSYSVANQWYLSVDNIKIYIPPPHLVVSPDSLVIPMNPDQILDTTFFLTNTGGELLTYSMIENPDTGFLSEDPTSGDVPPGLVDTIHLQLDATGYGLGTYRTVLEITSNSQKAEKALSYFPVTMKIGGPILALSPDSFHIGLCPPATKDTFFFKTNTGNEPLDIYGVQVVQTYPKGTKFYMGILPREEPKQGKDDQSNLSNQASTSKRKMAFKSGGPDIYGHYWRDSDDLGGPTFNWIDISGTGTQILGFGDDTNLGKFPLGFTFNFYGTNFDSIYACSNGWFSFTSTLTSYTNYALPSASASVPENMLAIFWDDMNFTLGGTAYYQTIGDKFIIEYKDAPRYSYGYLYTYEMILDKTCGTITYQYLSMQPGMLNSATIGIQNALKSDGLTIAYDELYVHDSLAIQIQTTPLWVSLEPCNEIGTLAAGEHDSMMLIFDSSPYTSGNFRGEVRVSCNQPGHPIRTLPIAMDILSPGLAVSPASIVDTCQEGGTVQKNLRIQNSGNCPLDFSIGAGCSWVSVLPTGGSLNPDQYMDVTVTEDCSNLYAGNYVCELRISSNDPTQQPYKIVNIYKHVGPDPAIAVSPDSFHIELFAGTTLDTSMNILNNGAGHLVYGISTEDFTPPKVGTPILTEGFEGSWPPSGWTTIQYNTGYQYGYPCFWSQMNYPSVHSGLWAAGLWWSYYDQDEWLITPEFTLAGPCSLSFWTYGYEGSTYGDHYYVKISTNGGASWNVLFDLSTLTANAWNYWDHPYKIGLDAYAGQNVKIAWHAYAIGGLYWAWLIDDVDVESYAPPWLVVGPPTSGTIDPGKKSVTIPVHFSSEGITTNDKYAHIFIASNDPVQSMTEVRAHMKVVGPEYSVTPAETLVINATENAFTDGFLHFGNTGFGPLICKLSDPVGWLAELPDSFVVPISSTFDDTVRVDGYQLVAGDYATKVFIKTNDFDEPYDTVVVIVHVGPPAGIAIDPTSFEVQVVGGTTKDTAMIITNTGDGHLAFAISTVETGGPKLSAGTGLNTDGEYQILKRNWPDHPKPATPSLTGTENPRTHLIASNSGNVSLSAGIPDNPKAKGDTVYMQMPMGSSESWSAATSDQGAGYKVCENFWDLTQPIAGIGFWGLPMIYSGGWLQGDPNNLVFDITFYSDDPSVIQEPTSVVCTYTNVVPSSIVPTESYSGFQAYLFAGIDLNPPCNLSEGWVSIESKSTGEGDDWFLWMSAQTGDGVSCQAGSGGTCPYYYDDAFFLLGGQLWLTVSPKADTVNPHTPDTCTVTFDATNILGGEKFGDILINSNAPGKRVDTVKVHMIVGGAQYAITPDSLHIEGQENQYTNAYLTISNPGGQGPLSYKMTDPVAWLMENPDTADIPPNEDTIVTVRVDGHLLIAGNYLTQIAIKSNGANQQYDTIPVTVHIGPNAEVNIAPMSFDVGVFPGTTPTTRTIKVSNELGAGHLGFVTSIEETSPKLTAGRQGSVREQLEAIRNSVQPKPASEGAQKVIGFEKSTQTMPAKSGGAGTPGTPGGMLLRSGGKASILLVDDDGGLPGGTYSDIEDRYMDALDANGFVYDYYVVDWTDPLSPGPDLATMQNYGCVIWFTGETWGYYGNDTFTPTDETNVAAYLDGGGNLFLSAQDYLWDMYPSAGSFSPGQFPYDYLGLQSASQDVINDPYIAYGLAGSVAAGMQFDALRCFDLNPTVPLWTDDLTGQSGTVDVFDASGFISAVQYDAGTFKTVFTTTEFAGLVDASPSTRAELIASILDWFGCIGPGCPFTATPAADTLDPGTSIDVLLTFDGTAFEACGLETLTCYLVFNTNDPDEALVTVPVTMWSQRGDVDADHVINVVDVVFLLNYIFIDGPAPDPPCLGDVDQDGDEDSDDVLYLISYLFLGGPPPKILLAPSR